MWASRYVPNNSRREHEKVLGSDVGAETKWRIGFFRGTVYDSVKEANEPRVNSPRNWRFVQFRV